MVRNQPKRMAKLVPKIKDDKILSKEALKALSALQKRLDKLAPMAPFAYDPNASKACEEFNKSIEASEEKTVPDGALLKTMEQLLGGQKRVKGREESTYGWEGDGVDYVLYVLAEYEAQKKAELHPMIDKNLKKMGLAMNPHQAFTRVVSTVFVDDFVNMML